MAFFSLISPVFRGFPLRGPNLVQTGSAAAHLQFGAPSRRTPAPGTKLNSAVVSRPRADGEGAVGCTRGGCTPHSNGIVPVQPRRDLRTKRQPQRGDIVVASAMKMNSSSVGAEYAAPPGLAHPVTCRSTKIPLLTELWPTATRLQLSARGCSARATLGQRTGIP